jgi:hypothetical protein
LSSTISIFCAIDRLSHRAISWPGLSGRKLRASAIKGSVSKLRRLELMYSVTPAMELNQLLTH